MNKPTLFSPDSGPPQVNTKEAGTDMLSMVALDTLNRLNVKPDMGAYGGMAVGVAIWQGWGKQYLKKNLQKLTLTEIASDPAEAEKTAELDAELLLGLKGGIYTLSTYLSSLAVKGRADKMNLVDAVLIGYGGSLAGAVVRSYA